MKTILTKLPDDKAKKEVKQFTYWGLALSAASLLIFWWLAIAGIAFCSRGLLLTWHKANRGRPTKYGVLSALGVLLGLISLIWH